MLGLLLQSRTYCGLGVCLRVEVEHTDVRRKNR